MKKMFFAACALFAVATMVTFTSGKTNSENSLLMQNVEALASIEESMNMQIWILHAESVDKWTCKIGGTSACPMP